MKDELLAMVQKEMAQKPHYLLRIERKPDRMVYEVYVGLPDRTKKNLLITSTISLEDVRIIRTESGDQDTSDYPLWLCIWALSRNDGHLQKITPVHKNTLCAGGFPDGILGKQLENIITEQEPTVYKWDKRQNMFVSEQNEDTVKKPRRTKKRFLK